MPRISVVLPVYNGQDFLADAIASIQDQTVKDWELLIVDDCSTDESLKVIQRLRRGDSRIRCYHHKYNKGVAASYNTGIAAASTRWIAFQEQDDISLPVRLEYELEVLARTNAALVTSRVGWIDETKRVYHIWPPRIDCSTKVLDPDPKHFADILVDQTSYANATTMMDRYQIDAQDLKLDERFRRSGQDWDWHLRLVRRYRTVQLSEVLVHMRRYRQHKSATSNKRQIQLDNRSVLQKHAPLILLLRPPAEMPSGLSQSTIRHAWSNEFLLEARWHRGLKGLILGAASILLWPASPAAHVSLRNFIHNTSSKRRTS